MDSNMLSDPALRDYLSHPSKPLAVLCDYAGIEAYQAKDPIAGMSKSMSIVCDYPGQVLVLKNTPKIVMLRPRLAGMQRRMIDEEQTQNFGSFCEILHEEAATPGPYRAQLLEKAKSATDFGIKGLVDTAPKIEQSTKDLWDEFTGHEQGIIRRGLPLPAPLAQKIAGQVVEIAEQAFEDLGIDSSCISGDQVLNTFLGRYTLCSYLRTQQWMIVGGVPGPRQARNTVIDCGFVTYATFFDGFLTNDKKADENFRLMQRYLSRVGR